MKQNHLEMLAARIHSLLATVSERPVLVALDGRCGSGKTTLAFALATRFPASSVVHTDDFYLPPAERVPGWETVPCANMDLKRLRDEVLVPLRNGYTAQYRPYCCGAGAYRAGGPLVPQPLVLVEGSYSHHPLLAGFYDLRVFVTCSSAVQAARLRQREGAHYAAFASRWIPLEEAYFQRYRVEKSADMRIDTSAEPEP